MRPPFVSCPPGRSRLHGITSRLHEDCRGTTAVEFALVAAPFFLLLLGIMTAGLQFFTIESLEHGVATAARKVRTGEAQKQGKTLADFRQMVCDAAGSYIKCDDKLVVHVKSGAAFADLDPPTPCTTNGTLTAPPGPGTDPLANHSGTQTAAVVVTACYEWEFGGSMWQKIWNLLAIGPGEGGAPKVAGKTIVQATSTFRTEPYQ